MAFALSPIFSRAEFCSACLCLFPRRSAFLGLRGGRVGVLGGAPRQRGRVWAEPGLGALGRLVAPFGPQLLQDAGVQVRPVVVIQKGKVPHALVQRHAARLLGLNHAHVPLSLQLSGHRGSRLHGGARKQQRFTTSYRRKQLSRKVFSVVFNTLPRERQ